MNRPLLIVNGLFVSLTTSMFITPPTVNNKIVSDQTITPLETQTNKPITNIVVNKKQDKASPTPKSTQTVQPESSPTPVQSSEPVKQAITGSFIGDVIDVTYGNMQVKLVIQNNIIVDAQAIQYPNTGKSASLNSVAIAQLRQETLTAQSANIRGISGASYTSYGWYKSLVSALTKAGL